MRAYANWPACAAILLNDFHLAEAQAEKVLRSDIMQRTTEVSTARWGKVSALDLARYLAKFPQALEAVLGEEPKA
jgi:hypothetical protein